ncbi:hypothetical protein FF098_015935 [Parvularcula flava]|uniref:Uncharacterized protein n=1 Tax=Aquisalinus luteolus TaxID=1566827 RepID=A0A8J3EQG2_9PROT|nr:hypothetical protein [Aquisalinus luteolus]NHK29406.1 hypothetical protein [Aquisalinus luteolus]GGI02047.1 hypothetical protein GCM10011355_34130 [Aquisalinus luteolus]
MSLKRELESIDLPAFRSIAGNAKAFRSIAHVELWAKNARQQVAEHIRDNREAWLNQERERIALARHQEAPQLNPPNMARPTIEQEAQRAVSLKAEGYMAEVARLRQAQIEEITRTPNFDPQRTPVDRSQADRQNREPAHPLKKDTHRLIDRGCRTLAKVERHFGKMRQTWIEQAQARGSEDAVGDVYRNYRARKDLVRQAMHRINDRSFKAHGIDRAVPENNVKSGPEMA